MTYDKAFAALADPTRRSIFENLRAGPRTVTDLSTTQPVSRPAVSQHLKVLRDAGLVTVRAEGTKRFFTLRREGLQQLRDYLDTYWTDVLIAYANEIKNQSGE